MAEIEFTIDTSTGKCETTINGIQGPACEKTAKKLRQVLGTPAVDQKTPEFNATPKPKRLVGSNE